MDRIGDEEHSVRIGEGYGVVCIDILGVDFRDGGQVQLYLSLTRG